MEHDNPTNYNTNRIELSVESLFFYHTTMESMKNASRDQLYDFLGEILKHHLYTKQYLKEEFGKNLGFKP